MGICLLAAFLFGCAGTPTASGKTPQYIAENLESEIDANLQTFLGVSESVPHGNMGNRTPTSEAEHHAAQKLYRHFTGQRENPDYDFSTGTGEQWIAGTQYDHIEVTPLEDTKFEVTTDDEEQRTSYNVEVRYTGGTPHEKQVIVGAGYDTAYGKLADEFHGQLSTGALENGVAVATLMTMIDYCEKEQPVFDFDLTFVFFGCSAYNSLGARNYVKSMEPSKRLNTLLMINLYRLGGDRTYLYADEVPTAHEDFLRGVAEDKGISVYTLPSNMPIIDGTYRTDVGYVHYGMLGDHTMFVSNNIPSAVLQDGYYGGFNFSDVECKGKSNLGATKEDTYQNLVEKRPQYKQHAASALSLVLHAVQTEGFADAATRSRTSTKDFTGWTNPFWANMTVIFVIVALAIVLIVVVKLLEKKHPYEPKMRKLKIAVFGMDYEDKEDGDIYIDVKPRKNPFDGY